MSRARPRYPLFAVLLMHLLLLSSCGNKKVLPETYVNDPKEVNTKAGEFISAWFTNGGLPADSSFQPRQPELLRYLYEKNGFAVLWSDQMRWKPGADSLFVLIRDSRYFGLFPEDYHFEILSAIREKFNADSLATNERRDALAWSRADLLLTDALVQLARDVKLGRLPNDSISLNKDTLLQEDFFLQHVNEIPATGAVTALLQSLEPRHWGYQQLKKGIRRFLEQADFRQHSIVPPPSRKATGFKTALQKRLYEGGYIAFDSVLADSAQLADAVKKFQKEKGITVDGIAGESTVRMLNLSDREKFIRIAISMDKYKKLPAEMPSKYIWVNTSSNYLDVVKDASVEFSSRIITGKPKTRTPLLNGAISVLITYPQWVPPPSIVNKEILPAVKKNPGYLSRKGFSLLDREGNEVDPYTVDWSKYSRNIPYRIVQGSGDANALGVLKFHFDNKYSVYLHDTNQRYLFANAARSLSHGCVRVQEWEKLAMFVLGNDKRMGDTLRSWLKNKQKHNIGVRNKIPVFIRYLTCEGKDGNIVFYDDVYGDDQYLKEKYFARK